MAYIQADMDEKPKKRPWFQYHLSTAIVLQFEAGGLLWANMSESDTVKWYRFEFSDEPGVRHWQAYQCITKGYPLSFYEQCAEGPIGSTWCLSALFKDCAFAAAALFAVAFVLEWRIRRK